jgi:hypothetical protein
MKRIGQLVVCAAVAALPLTRVAAQGVMTPQDDHGGHTVSAGPLTTQQSALVEAVRKATEQYKHVTSIEGPGNGYALTYGCVTGGELGAMGMHYINMDKVFDGGKFSVDDPEIILFEPTPNGGIRLTGADFIVMAADWDPTHPNNPPQLFGQLFHYFGEPNRFMLKPFYTLHVWAWKDNPNGTFTNWNPTVSCDAYAGPSNGGGSGLFHRPGR